VINNSADLLISQRLRAWVRGAASCYPPRRQTLRAARGLRQW